MQEHDRDILFKYKFIETDAFRTKNGILSKSAQDDLDFYLIIGRVKPIEGTGGLKVVRCDIGGFRKKEERDIVFAAYSCPHIRTYIFYLLVKYPIDVIDTMNKEQKKEFKTLKQKVDTFIRQKYGK
jgi:hypothetical protein